MQNPKKEKTSKACKGELVNSSQKLRLLKVIAIPVREKKTPLKKTHPINCNIVASSVRLRYAETDEKSIKK